MAKVGRLMATTVSPDILEDWLTIREAAQLAGVCEAVVIEWIRQGRVPAFYVATETETVH